MNYGETIAGLLRGGCLHVVASKKKWLLMGLIVVAASLVTTPAAAFKLTVANQFDKQKSIVSLFVKQCFFICP